MGVSSTATLDPEIIASAHEMNTTGVIDSHAVSYFDSRGPAQFLARVRVPTLILQGTVDDLFTLDEGIANYEELTRTGTTVAMAWFCGGHGVCLTDPGTALQVGPLSLAWMQRYVAGDSSVHVLTGFAFVDQNGTSYAARSYPLASGSPITAKGSGTLQLRAGGGSGPPVAAPNAQAANVVDLVATPVTPAPATNALNVTVPVRHTAIVVGAPKLSITYSGSAESGTRPTRIFAQLVDPETGIVVNNQITPIPVTLDGKPHTVTVPLETIGYTAQAGTSLELQLVAATVAYVTPQLGGSITFTRARVVLRIVQRGEGPLS
jgi:ABC-2 type transport system ATP-binding protein